MKKWFTFLLVFIFIFCSVYASAEITGLLFGWDANTEEDLAGYRLYSSDTSGVYNIGDPNSYIDIADPNTITYELDYIPYSNINYFVLTAYDDSGNESDMSNEVAYNVFPSRPGNFRIIIHIHTQ